MRTLRADLGMSVPSARTPLDQLDHPLLVKARAQFADAAASHERIRAIDDEILFKVKVQRWRGAVWTETGTSWVVAAGSREDGSPEDFYAALESRAVAARARYNSTHAAKLTTRTDVTELLPEESDRQRLRIETGLTFWRALRAEVWELTGGSLRDGHEHAADYPSFRVGVLVRADQGHETYAAVRITGSVPDELVATILSAVPGCDPDTWWPEHALPARHLMPAEQAWSTLMDPKMAAKLLETLDDGG